MIFRSEESDEYYFEEGCYILELLNSKSDEQASIARARVLTGRSTKWHSLTNTVERYLIIAGEGKVEVGTEAGQQVKSGDVVVIPAGMRQRIHCIGDEDLVFMAVCTPRFQKANYCSLE